MRRIELTGLRGDLPIGAMAALAVLRICSRSERIAGAKLCWSGDVGDFRAALETENDVSAEDLLHALVSDVHRKRDWPDWEQVKTLTPEEFRPVATDSVSTSLPDNRERCDWIGCLTTELSVSRDGKLESTPFDMSVARQKFLTDARRLSATVGSDDEYREALFGPWKYRDDQHSLGWDPTTIRLGAFTYKAPTDMVNSGVRAAVWLAFQSLPLFACFYAGGLRTRGFMQNRRETTLVWPIWRPPISLQELAILLGWVGVYKDAPKPKRAEMRARGIAAVYRSERFKPNQYMTTFRSAYMAYSE